MEDGRWENEKVGNEKCRMINEREEDGRWKNTKL
jgi:hypothetical protein